MAHTHIYAPILCLIGFGNEIQMIPSDTRTRATSTLQPIATSSRRPTLLASTNCNLLANAELERISLGGIWLLILAAYSS